MDFISGKPTHSIDRAEKFKPFFKLSPSDTRREGKTKMDRLPEKFCFSERMAYNREDIFHFLENMAQVTQDGYTFTILDEIQAEYPELIKLVLATESMDTNEKQYWFDILPSMTDEQVDRLFDILETERRKLEELEVRYQEEIKNLNEKHLIEWQEFQSQENRKKVKQAEASDEKNSKDTEDILNMLNNL